MQKLQRPAPAGQVVVDAALHQRAAVARGVRADFIGAQPQRAQDAGVERAAGLGGAERAGEGKAQVGDLLAAGGRHEAGQVGPEQRLRAEAVRRLFQHLARAGGGQGLAGLQMAGGLVQAHAVDGFFLHHEKEAVALDDGGDGDRGLERAGGHRLGGRGADPAGSPAAAGQGLRPAV